MCIIHPLLFFFFENLLFFFFNKKAICTDKLLMSLFAVGYHKKKKGGHGQNTKMSKFKPVWNKLYRVKGSSDFVVLIASHT